MILLGLLLLALALVGAPLFAVIAAGALWSYHQSGAEASAFAIEVYGLAELPVLLAIPLFTFAGYLLSESRAPQRVVRLTNALLGWLPGGLAVVALCACAVFTAFTGGSGITIIALGALLYPALRHAGYGKHFSLGLVTCSGSLGLLFAPSLPLILYGIVAQTDIDQLFLAGLLPGLLLVLAVSAWSIWVNRAQRVPLARFSWAELRAAARAAALEIPLPVFVLGGIYGGFFAVSEAAAVTAVYTLVVEVFLLRDIPLARLPRIVRESMCVVGAILIILGVSLASTNYLILAEVPQRLFETVSAHVSSQLTFLTLLVVFLLALRCFLDIFSALVLVLPLILPVAAQYEVHPVHLAIIFVASMELGYMTPPMGLNLFVASYRFNEPVLTLFWATLPFLLILLLAVLVITYWPALSLVLLSS